MVTESGLWNGGLWLDGGAHRAVSVSTQPVTLTRPPNYLCECVTVLQYMHVCHRKCVLSACEYISSLCTAFVCAVAGFWTRDLAVNLTPFSFSEHHGEPLLAALANYSWTLVGSPSPQLLCTWAWARTWCPQQGSEATLSRQTRPWSLSLSGETVTHLLKSAASTQSVAALSSKMSWLPEELSPFFFFLSFFSATLSLLKYSSFS